MRLWATPFAFRPTPGGLRRNTAKHLVRFWAEAFSEGSRFGVGGLEGAFVAVACVRAPGEGAGGLLGQVEVGLGVVEDVVGDLEQYKVRYEPRETKK